MKTKKKLKLFVLLTLIMLCMYLKFFAGKAIADHKPSKPFLTVSEAKVKAFQNTQPVTVTNLKGIFTAKQLSGSSEFYYLEDIEPAGMEDVPLYCSFSQESQSYIQSLEPGTELIISGELKRRGNSAEVVNCNIICINKGTLDEAQLSYKF